MSIPGSARRSELRRPAPGKVVGNKREQNEHDALTADWQAARVRTGALVREMRVLSRRHAVLAREFEHRLVNSVRWIASLLLLQSRAAATPEAAAHLATVAHRVAVFGRVHRRPPVVDRWASGGAGRHLHAALPCIPERLFISPGEEAGEDPGSRASPTSRFPTSPEHPEKET